MKKIILAIVTIAVLCGFYCVNVINSLVVLARVFLPLIKKSQCH